MVCRPAGDLFLKMLRRMKQQWAVDVAPGPELAIDLDALVNPDVKLGPTLTSLDEGMGDAINVSADTRSAALLAGGGAASGSGQQDGGIAPVEAPCEEHAGTSQAWAGEQVQQRRGIVHAADGAHAAGSRQEPVVELARSFQALLTLQEQEQDGERGGASAAGRHAASAQQHAGADGNPKPEGVSTQEAPGRRRQEPQRQANGAGVT